MTPSPAPQNDSASDVPGLPPIPPKPRDMSQYIRTYAKDVAMLTHQPPPPSPAPPTPSAPQSFAQSDTQTTDGVTLPEFDESPVNRRGGFARQFEQETLSLSKEDSEGIFANKGTASIPPPPQPTPTPPEPSDSERRDSILARLRAKASSEPVPQPKPVEPPPPPLPPPAPIPAIPEPEPIPPPLPTPALVEPYPPLAPEVPLPRPNFDAYRVQPTEDFHPVPPPPQPKPAEPPPSPPPPPNPTPVQEAVPSHTYTSDFADRIDQQQASTFSVLAAQQDAKPAAPTLRKSSKRSLVPVVLASVLILVGAGGLYAAYALTHNNAAVEKTLGVPSLITADEKVELEGPDYRQALADAANQPLVSGNILVTYVAEATSTSIGLRREPQPGGVLIRFLRLGAPDILMRNVDITSTVGIIAAGNETRPFFIMRVNSFERTFAGMLGWEGRMQEDLGLLYPAYAEIAPSSAMVTETSASSTVPNGVTIAEGSGSGRFVDAVVANHDVRVLRDAYGRSLILYGYSDRQTLIIARNEESFTALSARLAATNGN